MNKNRGMRQDSTEKCKQKSAGRCLYRAMASANKRSCHRPLLISHVPRYRTVSKHTS